MVLAKTAPVAPATASPQGGIGASLDNPAMTCLARGYSYSNFPQRSTFGQSESGVAEVAKVVEKRLVDFGKRDVQVLSIIGNGGGAKSI